MSEICLFLCATRVYLFVLGTSAGSIYSKGVASAMSASPRLRRTDSLRQRSSSVSSVLTQSTLISVEPHNSNLNCTQLGVLGIDQCTSKSFIICFSKY